MREDDPRFEILALRARVEASSYAHARGAEHQTALWSAHYNGYFSGFMANAAALETAHQMLALKTKLTPLLEGDGDDLLGDDVDGEDLL